MTILQEVYASAPTNNMRIVTIEIQVQGLDPIRIVNGFQDMSLGTDEGMVNFQAGSMSISLPAKNTSGQQNLSFGISNATGEVQRYIDHAIEQSSSTILIYREYLLSDLTSPATRPLVMDVKGGLLQGGNAQIDASFSDLLNLAWPRERYTQLNAPGIRYI